ncbi:CRISPR-associated endonuclease Cas1 [Pseudodesulfovibrio sp.]|uniref:CRISPR-associated endonuclease Cas1 n=1 Tax=unclassified Pseudodesulfovibrio TaxID=2661612 RepID=UPI003AFF8B26
MTLRFLTPLRIKRPDRLQTPLRTHLDGDCFPADYFLQRLHARLSKVLKAAHAISGQDARFEKPSMPEDAISAQIKENRLYWLDAPLKRGQGKSLEHAKPHLGAMGYVVLANVPEQWLPLLVMGQYLHLGESLAFGLGRYVIEEGYTRQDDPFRPTRSILDQAMDMPVLHEAVHHVLESSDATSLDSQSPADFQDNAQLQDIRSAVLAGNYTPSALQGVLIPKASGGLRPLAIPTVPDRITQRAVYATLSPTVDTLLEDCSYAYRKGLSRRGAANAINRAYREGFRYVLDADITCFFDSVPWDRLFAKLDAFFPFDPVVRLLKLWTTAPVMFDDRRIERSCGLPQGSSVSPLLANLYLDEFDEELLGADFRLVRYADDFVVLCRDMDAAKAAWNKSAQALHKLGLSLHPDKTGIRDIDHGFTYLGFLFCRSLVLEKQKDSIANNSNETSAPIKFPTCSWLAQVPMQRLMDLAHHGSATSQSPVSAPQDRTTEDNPVPERSIASDVQPDEKKLPLYILDPEVEVTKSGNALEIRPLKGSPQTIPLNALSHTVFIGRPRLSLPGLLGMHQAGVPTFFCRRSGALNLAIDQDKPDWKLWMAQARLQEDEDRRLVLSRAIVAGKLFNQAGTLVRFKLVGPDDEAARLRAKARMCENATHLDELRGIEGSGATLYFLAIRRAFPTEWAFQGREKRPPPDPINAMLSFGYTLLHNHVSTALQIAGFNPRIGVYHQMRGTHHALASDVQEEFRHLVDGLVLSKVHRREARLEHFTAGIRDGKQSIIMDNAFCKRFISAFETRLLTTFKGPDGEKITYRACMDQQAVRLRETILKGTATYTPMRIQR